MVPVFRCILLLFCVSIYGFLSLILCICFGVDFLRVTVCHDSVTSGGAKCMCSSAEELSVSTHDRNSETQVWFYVGSPALWEALWEMQSPKNWGSDSGAFTALSGSQNADLVQQLRTISKPAFSIGLMEIKTFLQNSEGLGDLTS